MFIPLIACMMMVVMMTSTGSGALCFPGQRSNANCPSYACLGYNRVKYIWYGMVWFICIYVFISHQIITSPSPHQCMYHPRLHRVRCTHFINPHFFYITQCLCSVHSEITGKNHYLLIWAKSICKAWPFLLPVSENCHWPGQWVGSEYRRQQSI